MKRETNWAIAVIYNEALSPKETEAAAELSRIFTSYEVTWLRISEDIGRALGLEDAGLESASVAYPWNAGDVPMSMLMAEIHNDNAEVIARYGASPVKSVSVVDIGGAWEDIRDMNPYAISL